MGNMAVAFGFLTASQNSGLELFYGGYPITPASDILHYLSSYKNFHVKTFQAEDEIAGVVSAIGAAYAGNLAVTATSGPGMALKTEAIGLAVITELPIVIVNVQRGGPSTGLPTKTEQSDLLQAMWGRHGEAPCVVMAANSPADCFEASYEACRIAVKYMIPVILLTDGYIANGSEPWRIPDVNSLKKITTTRVTKSDGFEPYDHSSDVLARPWAIPGTPGLEHRVGGLEKSDGSGNVSHNPQNHHYMVQLRQNKVDIIAKDIPNEVPYGDTSGDLLVLGWGGTKGALRSAVNRARENGKSVSHIHLRYLNPLPNNLGELLLKFKKVLIPELNMGQLATIIRAKYLVETISFSKLQGKPFTTTEVYQRIITEIGG